MIKKEQERIYDQYIKYEGQTIKSPMDLNDYFIKSITKKIDDPNDENGFEIEVVSVGKDGNTETRSIQKAILFFWTKPMQSLTI
ncbi:MAG: hypothetical protein IT234_05290 [Bacteroidia bacterium]|nr:hypothetical protein [Bacteroidia bacterium]